MKIKTILCSIIFLLATLSSFVLAATKPSIGIMDFEIINPNGLPKDIQLVVPGWLSAYLVKSNRYAVLERSELYRVLKSKSIEKIEIFDSEKVKEYASLLGTDFIIYGAINNRSGYYTPNPFLSIFEEKESGKIEITAKIVDLNTGEIIFSDSAFSSDVRNMESAVEKIVEKIIGKLPLKGYVISIKQVDKANQVIIDLGQDDGVVEDDIMSIVGPGKQIRHPVTDELIYLPDKQIAEVRISEVHNNTALGTVSLFRGNALKDILPGIQVQSKYVNTYSLRKKLKRFSEIYGSTSGMGYVGLATAQGGMIDINPAGLPQVENSEVSLQWQQVISAAKTNGASDTHIYGAFPQNPIFPHAMNFSTVFGNGIGLGINLHTDTIDAMVPDQMELSNGDFTYSVSIAKALNTHFMVGGSLIGEKFWHRVNDTRNNTFRANQNNTAIKLGFLLRPNSALRLGGIYRIPFFQNSTYEMSGATSAFSDAVHSEWGLGLIYLPLNSLSLGLDLVAKFKPQFDTFYETHLGIAYKINDIFTATLGTYTDINYIPNLVNDTHAKLETYSISRNFLTGGLAMKFNELNIELSAEHGFLTNTPIIRPSLTAEDRINLTSLNDTKVSVKVGTSF